jgi:hypothetical protein
MWFPLTSPRSASTVLKIFDRQQKRLFQHYLPGDIAGLARYERRPPTEAAFGMTGALGGAEPPRNTDNQRSLQAPSASLAIPAAISFASFAQLVLVEAGLSQFGARISPNWSLAGLPVSAAISFAPLA